MGFALALHDRWVRTEWLAPQEQPTHARRRKGTTGNKQKMRSGPMGSAVARAFLCTSLVGSGPAWSWGADLDVDAEASMAVLGTRSAAATRAATHLKAQVSLSHTRDLGLAWRQHLSVTGRIESASSSCGIEFCGNPKLLEGRVLLGLSHYAHGRFLFGRNGGLLSSVAQAASAFGTESVGADRCLSLLTGACPPLRPFSMTWEMPTFAGLEPALQVAVGNGAPSLSARADFSLWGGRVLAAYSTQGSGNWLMPLGISMPVGRFRISALTTRGSSSAMPAPYSSVGLEAPAVGGEWKLQWSTFETSGPQARQRKLAVGYQRPLSMNCMAYLDLAQSSKRSVQERRWAADLGLRWVLR